MVSITVQSRSGKPSKKWPVTVSLGPNPTVSELKAAVEAKTKMSVHRQRLTTLDKSALGEDESLLSVAGLKDGDSVQIKDLGPQISWRTVFLTEYFGPLFIHPFFYFAQKVVYRSEFEHSKMQKVAMALVLAHYAKREFETVFVHRFSNATMPIFNIFKNCAHYWGLSGLLLAVPLYGPWYSAKSLAGGLRSNDNYIYAAAGVMLFAELSNLITHLNLRSLRPAGTKTRQIPRGYGFNWVSCPNYFFETVAWTAFTALTLDPAAALFVAVATGQMAVWALKKHKRYRKEFGDKYPRRKAMFPLIF